MKDGNGFYWKFILGAMVVALLIAPTLTIILGNSIDSTLASAVASSITTGSISLISYLIQQRQWIREDRFEEIRRLEREEAKLELQLKALEQLNSLLNPIKDLLNHQVTSADIMNLTSTTSHSLWKQRRNDLLQKIAELAAINNEIYDEYEKMADHLYKWNGRIIEGIDSGLSPIPDDVSKTIMDFEVLVKKILQDTKTRLSDVNKKIEKLRMV